MPGPLALVNGDVWTLARTGERHEAILVEGDRIVAVGEERSVLRKARALGARQEDVGGATVLPGLIDSHAHLVHQGLLRDRLDLRRTRSKREALALVARTLPRLPGRGPLLAERWDESRWPERAYPTREELDAISRTRPIILRRIDGHIAVANTPACRALKRRLPGVHEDTGLLVEEASLNLNRVYPTPVLRSVEAAVEAQRRALGLGLTGVHDFVIPNYLSAYARLDRRGALALRVRASLYAGDSAGLKARQPTRRLEGGGVKTFADGSIGGHTAALTRPYADDPGNRGRLNHTDRALVGIARAAARGGRQPSFHAIGDAAIDQVLRAYARLPAARRKPLRPRIEHFEVHTPEHVRTAVELGLVLSMQPNFVGEWSRPGGLYAARFGDERRYRNNEFRNILAEGAHLAFGSDCMPLDPWWGLHSCVHAPYASQRLRLEDALRAYTWGSAWGLGWEDRLGTLEPGKLADLLVVDAEWKKPTGIRDARVRATMVGGAWVHRAG